MSARTITTYNALHLGDNLLHLHFLRKLAQRYPDIGFVHACDASHHGQLREVIADLPQITLADLGTAHGINAWRGAGGWFYEQPDRHDFVAIHRRWFAKLAADMGLESPITEARDLLFDYPALEYNSIKYYEQLPACFRRAPQSPRVLLVNSEPKSGQFSGYNPGAFLTLARRLQSHGSVIATTQPLAPDIYCTQSGNRSVTDIGRISQRVELIIGVATGPLWPTFNIWNTLTTTRVILLDHERVDIIPAKTVHTNQISQVWDILKERGEV